MLEERVDHLEDGALLGSRQFLDLLETLHEPCSAPLHGLGDRCEAQQLVRRDLERFGEWREHRARRLRVVALVVGDHPIRESHERAQLLLRESARQ